MGFILRIFCIKNVKSLVDHINASLDGILSVTFSKQLWQKVIRQISPKDA